VTARTPEDPAARTTPASRRAAPAAGPDSHGSEGGPGSSRLPLAGEPGGQPSPPPSPTATAGNVAPEPAAGSPQGETAAVRGPRKTPAGVNPIAAAMSEAQLEEHVRALCKDLGILRFHVKDSRGMNRGLPDDILIGAAGVLWRELKTERGRLTLEQRTVGDALRALGQDYAIWRPSGLISGRIARELAALAGRGTTGAVVRLSQEFPMTFAPLEPPGGPDAA
jgi:hypothetical protein